MSASARIVRPTSPRVASVRIDASMDDEARRLWVTRGVTEAGDCVVDGLPYRERAVVPRAPWRQATAGERARVMTSADDAPVGSTIDVVRVGDAFLAPFRALGFDAGKSVEECQALLRTASYTRAVETATPELFDFVESAQGLQFLGTCVQRSGLWSTTTHVDPDGAASFSGLHVDDWDRQPAGDRHASRRQMCVNLGSHDRFFVFVEEPVDSLGDTAREAFASEDIYSGIGRAVFGRSPDALIWKVRVRPGEAYIAPTDNLVHDGATDEGAGVDVNLSLRGHFRAAAKAASR